MIYNLVSTSEFLLWYTARQVDWYKFGNRRNSVCSNLCSRPAGCTQLLESRKEVAQVVARNNGTKTSTSTAAMWCGVVQTKAPNTLGPEENSYRASSY
eukprot:3931717-Rhodomonas_salina.1